MPIRVELAIREGWKATENERFGEVFEVRFISDERKILFRYAPKCEDRFFWEETFKKLIDYDETLSKLKTIIKSVDGTGQKIDGGCINGQI